jgi:hypothetical protein
VPAKRSATRASTHLRALVGERLLDGRHVGNRWPIEARGGNGAASFDFVQLDRDGLPPSISESLPSST